MAQAVGVSFATEQGLFESHVVYDDLMDTLRPVLEEYSVALADSLTRFRDLPEGGGPEALSAAIARVFPCDGTAVGTVPAALAAFLRADGFEEAVITAVNCGGKTDTLGSMTGALAGAFYGASAIPERLTEGLANDKRGRDHVIALGEQLGKLTRKRNGARLEAE